jgi:hypothetical protein
MTSTTHLPFVGGILRCDLCGHEHRAVAGKVGPLWIAKGFECERCGEAACVWDDPQHFATEEGAESYARGLEVVQVADVPSPPPSAS